MKNNILYQILLCFLLPFLGTAQFDIERNIDIKAEFSGGYDSLNNNLIIPLSVLENELQGRVHIRFIVEKDMSISIVEILRGISGCSECNREAVELVKAMPKWLPGYPKHNYNEYTEKTEKLKDSIPVRHLFTVSIAFESPNYPILPQGYDALKNYLTTNLVYTEQVLREKIEGKVYVQLLFGETGQVIDAILLKGMENCSECDKEAVRLMKSIPKEIMTANDEKYSPKPFFFNTYIDFKAE